MVLSRNINGMEVDLALVSLIAETDITGRAITFLSSQ